MYERYFFPGALRTAPRRRAEGRLSQREAPRSTLSVEDLLSEVLPGIGLRLLAGGGGVKRPIASATLQRPGLALAGQPERLRGGTIQVLGRSELTFLNQMGGDARRVLFEQVARLPIPCLILTHGATVSAELAAAAETHGLPILGSPAPTTRVLEAVARHLEDRLASVITLHGTLIDIYGVGVLILGESGIGKSESALELILRGHRLISDDIVTIRRVGSLLNGTGCEVSRFHMEVRGLGIINIKDLYGVAAVREHKDIELVIRLDPWQEGKDYDRLGLDEKTYTVLGLERPFIEMPVGPGRNLSVLLEVAARHHLLKRKGYHPAKELAGKIQAALGKKR
jgi:HPr kinase/phosphorylase